MSDRSDPGAIRSYRAAGIEVSYEVRRCIHAAECVRGLPEVFDTSSRPWIQPDRATPEAIAKGIRRCPSGALHYARLDGGKPESPETTTGVRVDPDGPIYLRGDLAIAGPSGVMRETRAALCGCGRSANAPFCDNTHRVAEAERTP